MLSRERAPRRTRLALVSIAVLGLAAGACPADPRPIGPGVTYERMVRPEGPWVIDVVRIDRSADRVEIRTTLGRGRENDFVNRCQSLQTLGDENADALAAKYNVKAAELKALNTAMTEFGEVQSKPRNGRAATASATKELDDLFEQLDKMLNEQLDPLMEQFRFTNAAFYHEYQTARSIVDSVASHEVKDAQASLPLTLPKAA